MPVTPETAASTRVRSLSRCGRVQVLKRRRSKVRQPGTGPAVAVAVNLTGVGSPIRRLDPRVPVRRRRTSVSSLNPRSARRWRELGDRAGPPLDGTICLTSNVTSDVIIDITGWFGEALGSAVRPINPIRLADTRQTHPDLNGGGGPIMLEPPARAASPGRRHPRDRRRCRAASLNIIAAGAWTVRRLAASWCPAGSASDVSTLNFAGGRPPPTERT
jgi:hypothetical protein